MLIKIAGVQKKKDYRQFFYLHFIIEILSLHFISRRMTMS